MPSENQRPLGCMLRRTVTGAEKWPRGHGGRLGLLEGRGAGSVSCI